MPCTRSWKRWQPSQDAVNSYDQFQARLVTPFATLGVLTDGAALLGIRFLPMSVGEKAATNAIAQRVSEQLLQYLAGGDHLFDVPLKLAGSQHELDVWTAMRAIPAGETETYGSLATRIGSSSRAVGTACGRNPVPVIIPCHRVVASTGLGGFMGGKRSDSLSIKQWLLHHESKIHSEVFELR
jgi:methylated-DNA-[protein]-cysteine S-methyltransferase